MSTGDVTITPGSGLGTVDEDGNIIINSSTLEAIYLANKNNENTGCGPCAVAKPICSICWAIGLKKLANGEAQTITVFGAPPNRRISFRFNLADGTDYITNLVTDMTGAATKKVVILNGAGTYKVTPVACDCAVTPACAEFLVTDCATPVCPTVSVSTSSDDCDVTVGNVFSGGSIYSQTCDRAVTVTPRFMSGTVPSGGTVQLQITVANANNIPVKFSLASLVLPAGLSGTVSIPQTVINGNQSLVVYFTLSATSGVDLSAQIVVSNGQGTYICSGDQYSASGGQDSVQIIAPSGGFGCDLRVESFTWNPSSILNGGTSQLALVLKNYGANTCTNVSMTSVSGPIGFSGPPLSFTGVTIAPGATYQVTSTGTISHTESTSQNFNAYIPAGHIQYVCNSANLSIGAQVQATVAVSASTISSGYCQGVLSFRVEPTPAPPNVIPVITGGLPNTTYNYTVSGAVAMTGQFTTDSSGNADAVIIEYASYQANSQVVVTITGPAPGNCQFPELAIQLPVVDDGGIGPP